MPESPYSEILKKIDDSTIIITSTNRLANTLLYHWLQFKKNKYGRPITKACVFSIQHWLDRLWHQMLLHEVKLPYVLSDSEALLIISQILQQKSKHFLSSDKHAKEILSAWQLLCHWQLSLADLLPYLDNQNTSHFFPYAELFQATCQQNNWIDQSQRLRLLSEIADLSEVLKKQNIQQVYFIGFDTMAPDLEYFITRVRSFGLHARLWKPSINNRVSIKFYQYQDKAHELTAVAQSLKRLSIAHPSKKIGVIVPDLQHRFLDLQAVFDEHLLPENVRNNPLVDNSQRVYTISGGIPLIEMPIVFQLLQWLMLPYINDFDQMMEVFTSPYIPGGLAHCHSRKQLSLHVKSTCYRNITIKQLMQNQRFQEHADSILRQKIVANQTISNHKYTATAFVSLIKKRISLLGWPGECRLSSLEYQALEQFYQVINHLALFERLNYQMNEKSWLIELKKLAQSELFQSKSNPSTNIYILGLLESADISFDYLFIVGLDSRSWPRSINPHPYLPYKLQQKHNMPHASAKRELDFAKRMTAHLLNQAPNIYLSFARIDEDNQLHMPSPLFNDYIPEQVPKAYSEHIMSIEHITQDNHLSQVENEEKLTLVGGVSIFKNMAECPYRAALINRLKILPDSEYKQPFDAREKGQVIHRILEYIWQDIKTLKRLQAFSLKALEKLIAECVERGLKAHKNYFAFIPPFMRMIEQKRLCSLMKKWLYFEAKRTKDFSAQALEKNITVELLGVKLSLRVDRIDRFDNGQSVVIDYKTSRKFAQKNWLNSPIVEPQLPLYAIFEDADAIAIALVNGHGIGFESLSNVPNWIQENTPKIYSSKPHQQLPSTFAELKNHWKVSLNKEMERFLAGEISLTPSASSCQYCEFGAICRKRFTYQGAFQQNNNANNTSLSNNINALQICTKLM